MKIKDLDGVLEVATMVTVVHGEHSNMYSDYNELCDYENGDEDIIYMSCMHADELYIVI